MKDVYTQQSLIKSKLRENVDREECPPQSDPKHSYAISELLRYSDSYFISLAYNTILHREPSTEAHDKSLARLRAGVPREFILFALRYSKEGREKGIEIVGLGPKLLVSSARKVPVLGWLIETLHTLFTLPRIKRRLEQLEASFHSKSLDVDSKTNKQLQELIARQSRVEQEVFGSSDTVNHCQSTDDASP
jgi:hypothetical protein